MYEEHIKHFPKQGDKAISLTLLSQHSDRQLQFHTTPSQLIGAFLEQVLDRLELDEGGKRVAELRNNYEPAMELVCADKTIELQNDTTLAAAGVKDGDSFHIAARPIKEKVLFCRYAQMA